MYTRIVTPLDGSKTAEKALPYVRLLGRELQLPVELLNVVDVVDLATVTSARNEEFLRAIVAEAERQAKTYLEGVSASLRGCEISCKVLKGVPEDVIVETAARDKGSLIAMATHGRSGLGRWLLGSVAEKVLRSAMNPLLLVRASEEIGRDDEVRLRSVIVPLDGSSLAEAVLPAAVALAKTLNLEIVLARAYRLPTDRYTSADEFHTINFDQLRSQMRDEAKVYLQNKAQELEGKGLRVSSIPLEGHAAEEIIGLGRSTRDNLIAMSTHGRSGLKRWILGSVTEKVVRHSGDPVLVLSPKARSGRVRPD
ncbi:MAG TPA: universal stress protein [Candidatus Eisenbacteria bacterium]|nr:universal stress protein [Candidatus Eisenbacteria bacterium]